MSKMTWYNWTLKIAWKNLKQAKVFTDPSAYALALPTVLLSCPIVKCEDMCTQKCIHSQAALAECDCKGKSWWYLKARNTQWSYQLSKPQISLFPSIILLTLLSILKNIGRKMDYIINFVVKDLPPIVFLY